MTTHDMDLFCGVKRDKTGNEGKGDEGQTGEGDGELLLIGHLVHVGGEVLVGLAVAGELLGLLPLPEHVQGSRRGGHGRSLGDGGSGGKGTDGGRREDGDEEGGNEGGLAHHLIVLLVLTGTSMLLLSLTYGSDCGTRVNDIIVPADWTALTVMLIHSTDGTMYKFAGDW